MRPENTAEQLLKARVRLVLGHPFFGTLSLRLKLVPGTLPTMATDGARIVYSPTFVDGLTPAELEGTLAHEVLHCALGHQCRRGGRDPELWNRAADLAINPILVANGFTLPAGALIDPAFDNLSAEEIYARLLQNTTGAGPNQTDQQPAVGGGTSGTAAPKPSDEASTSARSCPPPTPEQAVGVNGQADHPARPGFRGSLGRYRRTGACGPARRDAPPET